MFIWWILYTFYLLACQVRVTVWLRFLLLSSSDVSPAPAAVCWCRNLSSTMSPSCISVSLSAFILWWGNFTIQTKSCGLLPSYWDSRKMMMMMMMMMMAQQQRRRRRRKRRRRRWRRRRRRRRRRKRLEPHPPAPLLHSTISPFTHLSFQRKGTGKKSVHATDNLIFTSKSLVLLKYIIPSVDSIPLPNECRRGNNTAVLFCYKAKDTTPSVAWRREA